MVVLGEEQQDDALHPHGAHQHEVERPQRIHEELTPLVGKESILEPLVDHGIDFLQPDGNHVCTVAIVATTQVKKRCDIVRRHSSAHIPCNHSDPESRVALAGRLS